MDLYRYTRHRNLIIHDQDQSDYVINYNFKRYNIRRYEIRLNVYTNIISFVIYKPVVV